MRTIKARHEATVPFGIQMAALELVSAFNEMGRIEQHTQSDNGGVVAGEIASGAFNMHKASVAVSLQAIDENNTKLLFRASAKEGLLNQKTAAKAIRRILESMD